MKSNNIILSIHYHKTGSSLSGKLYKIFGKYINNYIYINHFKNKRIFNWDLKKNCLNIKKIKLKKNEKYQIYRESAPNFFMDIFSEMPKINKVIHLVRDPYEWCLSNYLYHVQNPTPEKWFNKINTNINTWFNKKELLFMSNEINLDFVHIEELINYIKSVYNCHSDISYYQYLKSISPEKAIIIETTRFLLNNNYHGGCDHLRMAINSKYLNFHSKNVLTLHMNNFRYNFEHLLKKLVSFIFVDKISKNKLKIINNDLKKKYNDSKKGNHVTYNKYSAAHKKKLLNVLKKNKNISFILNYIKNLTPKSDIINGCNTK
jgi:hypothetical protein